MPEDSQPLIAIYCWTGDIRGKFWFCEHDGEVAQKYSKHINDPMEDVEMYYDAMSDEYEHVVRSWGYNLPDTVIESLMMQQNFSSHHRPEVVHVNMNIVQVVHHCGEPDPSRCKQDGCNQVKRRKLKALEW